VWADNITPVKRFHPTKVKPYGMNTVNLSQPDFMQMNQIVSPTSDGITSAAKVYDGPHRKYEKLSLQ
jgi:hypothetical protein